MSDQVNKNSLDLPDDKEVEGMSTEEVNGYLSGLAEEIEDAAELALEEDDDQLACFAVNAKIALEDWVVETLGDVIGRVLARLALVVFYKASDWIRKRRGLGPSVTGQQARELLEEGWTCTEILRGERDLVNENPQAANVGDLAGAKFDLTIAPEHRAQLVVDQVEQDNEESGAGGAVALAALAAFL